MSCIAFFTFTLRSRAADFAGRTGQTYDKKGNPAAGEVIRRTLKAAGLSEASQAVAQDVASFLVRPGDSFDVAFLDPPYGANLLRDTLERVTPHMNRGGLIVCESDAGQEMPERVGDFALARTYRYGRVHIWLYRWETVEPEED